jgi:hypothetical protein
MLWNPHGYWAGEGVLGFTLLELSNYPKKLEGQRDFWAFYF